jgi:predicted nucleic acid-binding protein
LTQRELISDYLAWHVVVNDAEAVLAALDVEKRYRVSFRDALIIHAAQVAGADVLYSEDLPDEQRYGDVRVVNPLNKKHSGSGGIIFQAPGR